jgi:hypothetical protein
MLDTKMLWCYSRSMITKKDTEMMLTGYTEQKVIENFADAYLDGDVVRWVSNDRVPFLDMVTDFATLGLIADFQVEISENTRKIEETAFLKEYMFAQANRSEEEKNEERMMAQAAFGPDAKVINVVTGEVL